MICVADTKQRFSAKKDFHSSRSGVENVLHKLQAEVDCQLTLFILLEISLRPAGMRDFHKYCKQSNLLWIPFDM